MRFQERFSYAFILYSTVDDVENRLILSSDVKEKNKQTSQSGVELQQQLHCYYFFSFQSQLVLFIKRTARFRARESLSGAQGRSGVRTRSPRSINLPTPGYQPGLGEGRSLHFCRIDICIDPPFLPLSLILRAPAAAHPSCHLPFTV